MRQFHPTDCDGCLHSTLHLCCPLQQSTVMARGSGRAQVTVPHHHHQITQALGQKAWLL